MSKNNYQQQYELLLDSDSTEARRRRLNRRYHGDISRGREEQENDSRDNTSYPPNSNSGRIVDLLVPLTVQSILIHNTPNGTIGTAGAGAGPRRGGARRRRTTPAAGPFSIEAQGAVHIFSSTPFIQEEEDHQHWNHLQNDDHTTAANTEHLAASVARVIEIIESALDILNASDEDFL